MAMIPVCNPCVPFMGKLPRPLRVGSRITIRGSMTHGGDNRFVINLQTGPITYPRDDTALHLSVRPMESTIVRNHFQNKGWGREERSGHCPIASGQPYTIVITVGCNSFGVSINGVHYCDFSYRIRFEPVWYVCVEGQTVLNSIDLH